MSVAEPDSYSPGGVPWHWHEAVELFYIEEGGMEFFTPHHSLFFEKGECGIVNSNVLHMTKTHDICGSRQFLHLFSPSFIADSSRGRIYEKFVAPVVSSNFEIARLEGTDFREQLLNSFAIDENADGYEIRVRNALSELWLDIKNQLPDDVKIDTGNSGDERLKQILVYIYDNYGEKLSIGNLAKAAFTSQRDVYRLFSQQLHCTPVEFITDYRLQCAYEKLLKTEESVTDIAQSCGFNTSSYFGSRFREKYGCTPVECRHRWQNADNLWRK